MSEKLADELFKLVEGDQGVAFISDGIGVLPDDEIFDIARRTIVANNRVNAKIARWLLKHGQSV